MSNSSNHNDTRTWYDSNAEAFFNQTNALDLTHAYDAFLPLLPRGGRILDAGCGSGRDTKHFLNQGFSVTSFDLSPELARKASQYTGIDVACMGFEDMGYSEEFDGVFASATLLHIPPDCLPGVLKKLEKALVPGGVMYTSFKHGNREWTKDGILYFRAYDRPRLEPLICQETTLLPLKWWETPDLRPGRQNEQWLHLITKKPKTAGTSE